jgi:hypothetical protein
MWLCALVLIAGVRAFARPMPPSTVGASLAHGCPLPCLFGVMPGAMHAYDALAALRASPALNQADAPSLVISGEPGYLFTLFAPDGVLQFGWMDVDTALVRPADRPWDGGGHIEAASAPVFTVGVSPIRSGDEHVPAATLGELISAIGPPVRVYLSCENMQPRLMVALFSSPNGAGASAQIRLRGGRIRPETRVLALTTYSAAGFARFAPDLPFNCLTEHAWHGFMPVQALEDRPLTAP